MLAGCQSNSIEFINKEGDTNLANTPANLLNFIISLQHRILEDRANEILINFISRGRRFDRVNSFSDSGPKITEIAI